MGFIIRIYHDAGHLNVKFFKPTLILYLPSMEKPPNA